jgi:hypothetical protein
MCTLTHSNNLWFHCHCWIVKCPLQKNYEISWLTIKPNNTAHRKCKLIKISISSQLTKLKNISYTIIKHQKLQCQWAPRNKELWVMITHYQISNNHSWRIQLPSTLTAVSFLPCLYCGLVVHNSDAAWWGSLVTSLLFAAMITRTTKVHNFYLSTLYEHICHTVNVSRVSNMI